MLATLGGIRTHPLRDLKEPSLIVASDLPPSEMALLQRNMALGFATDLGGRTSHPAIMARARGIPAVVRVKSATESVRRGALALVDRKRWIATFAPHLPRVSEQQR